MSSDSWNLSRRLRRLIRRAVCERYGHSWKFTADTFHCRACHITGQDAYYRRRRGREFAR